MKQPRFTYILAYEGAMSTAHAVLSARATKPCAQICGTKVLASQAESDGSFVLQYEVINILITRTGRRLRAVHV